MRYSSLFSLMPMALALPNPLSIEDRSPLVGIPTKITNMAGARAAAAELYAGMDSGLISGSAIGPAVSQIFSACKPTATPTSISDARSRVASMMGLQAGVAPSEAVTSQSFFTNVLGLLLNGIAPADLQAISNADSPAYNNIANVGNPNLPAGSNTIYPQASTSDAPYSFSEAVLRGSIFIPPGFTYGQKMPIIFVAGTGTESGFNFAANIGKLLTADGYDPVYVNVPGFFLIDIDKTAERVAYAMNYIKELTGRQAALITWSQGSLSAQWAFKYFPSTRAAVTDSINVSGDFHGTLEAYFVCNGLLNLLACTPAVIQQDYYSIFVETLRSNGGDSGYVPTTTVYSLTDEIVQPQEGTTASSFLLDERNIGVSNNYLQQECFGLPGGGIYTHEGVLYNPLTYALIIDALTHDGPGLFSRVGRAPCQDVVAPGLSLADVIETEGLIPQALINLLAFQPKVFFEPVLPAYATF